MIFNFPEDVIKKVKVFYKFHDGSPITVVFIHGYASNHHGFDRVSKELDKLKISYSNEEYGVIEEKIITIEEC